MPTTELNFTLKSTNREAIREELATIFLKEVPGLGTGDLTSRYVYYVEKLQNGDSISLKRPAYFNKGFDFEVHVENRKFSSKRKPTMPKHEDIHDDLSLKKNENQQEFNKMVLLIDKIYACQNVSDSEIMELKFTQGFEAEMILKAIKWLFIEQDMTYWNWSGRERLYTRLSDLWL